MTSSIDRPALAEICLMATRRRIRGMRPNILLHLLFTMVLCACAPQSLSVSQQIEAGLPALRAEALKEIDIEACEKQGGTVRGVCMFGLPACVVPYADAGLQCTDSSECDGRCLLDRQAYGIEDQLIVGIEATGVCEVDSNPCGCRYEIKEGKVQQGICTD